MFWIHSFTLNTGDESDRCYVTRPQHIRIWQEVRLRVCLNVPQGALTEYEKYRRDRVLKYSSSSSDRDIPSVPALHHAEVLHNCWVHRQARPPLPSRAKPSSHLFVITFFQIGIKTQWNKKLIKKRLFLPQRRIFHFWKIHVSTTSHKLYFFVVLMPFHYKLLLWLFSVICLCITNWAPQIKYSLRAERLRYLMWCDDVKPLIFMAYSRLILLLFTLIIHSLVLFNWYIHTFLSTWYLLSLFSLGPGKKGSSDMS